MSDSSMYIKIGIFILVIVVVVLIYTQKSSCPPHAPLVKKCSGVAPDNIKNPVCVRGKWVEHKHRIDELL